MSFVKKEQVKAMTGREIIQDFIQSNKPTSHLQYQKMCDSMNSFDQWNEQLRIDFLTEFLDQYEILDEKFHQLVQLFCVSQLENNLNIYQKLKWNKIPGQLRRDFVKFLSFLAIYHVHYIGTIFQSFVNHFLPISTHDDEYLQQEELYKMAHDAIQMVISYNQLSSRVLLKCCIKQFPHIRHSAPILLGFVRNLIQLAENSKDEEIAVEIWSLIIDRLLQLDTSITELQYEERKLSFCADETNNSKLDESELEEGEAENPMEAKLDQLIAIILHYLHQKYGGTSPTIPISNEIMNDVNFKAISLATENSTNEQEGERRGKNHSILFKLLIEAFDEHVLEVVGVHSVPFIWFYLCSLSNGNCFLMLEFLWEVLRSPVSSPSELKKAQNASAFLCGFLARANYVDFDLCCAWIRRIISWCLEYLDKYGNGKKTARNQHSTFYANIQALLFVFCYRHDELHSLDALDRAQFSKLDQLIYNCLQPLHNISQGVALCFLNLNKRLQLIKSNKGGGVEQHLPQKPPIGSAMIKRRKAIVDLYFPFSFCSLTICTPFIFPLMRRFTPLSTMGSKLAAQSADDLIDHGGEMMEMSNNKIEEDGENGETVNDGGMPVDEGYEDELMCVQSVADFCKFLMRDNDNGGQQQQFKEEDDDEQDMEN